MQQLAKNKKSTIPDAALQSFAAGLLYFERLLAQVTINDALAAHGDANKIAQAMKELALGDSDAAGGKLASTSDHYSNAWKLALMATGAL